MMQTPRTSTFTSAFRRLLTELTGGLTTLLALLVLSALVTACAVPQPQPAPARDEAGLAEALRVAHESRLELQTQSSRIKELEAQVRDLSEMLAWNAERTATLERRADSLHPAARGAAQRGTSSLANPPPPAAARRVTSDEASAYRAALDLYFTRQYAAAITDFRDLLARFPGGSYADNAEYWIGESLYGLGDYNSALNAFERVFAYPHSGKTDDAQLKIGYCHLRLGDRQRAGEAFRKLVSLHPTSEYVERARGELLKLNLE